MQHNATPRSTQLPNSTATKIARTRATAAKLVCLLASDHDGEVLGAVRALKSTLLAAELDLHDLANIVEFSPHRGMLAASPREMIKCCRTCPELLTSKELAFVHSMARWHGTPTQQQLTWLCALVRALPGNGARAMSDLLLRFPIRPMRVRPSDDGDWLVFWHTWRWLHKSREEALANAHAIAAAHGVRVVER